MRIAIILSVALFAAMSLASVNMSSLVDEFFNLTVALERFPPTYVLDVEGCEVYVYVANFTLRNSPLTSYAYWKAARFSSSSGLLSPNETERLVDMLLGMLGPEVEVVVNMAWRAGANDAGANATGIPVLQRFKRVNVRAGDVGELLREVGKAVGMKTYLDEKSFLKALAGDRAGEGAAMISIINWRGRDLWVRFSQTMAGSTAMHVMTSNLSKALALLGDVRRGLGSPYDDMWVQLWYGPYLLGSLNETLAEALRNAAIRLEREMGTVKVYKDRFNRTRAVEGVIDIFLGDVGPLYLIFPYPNGTPPDRATAEKVVRRYIELSGFCRSPVVAEFWPKTGAVFLRGEAPLPWHYMAVAIAAAAAAAILAKKRRG